jgi:hypothetical protein
MTHSALGTTGSHTNHPQANTPHTQTKTLSQYDDLLLQVHHEVGILEQLYNNNKAVGIGFAQVLSAFPQLSNQRAGVISVGLLHKGRI